MADTQRTVAEILALLADNASGAISPQDLRDSLDTWRPRHGQMYVAAANAGAVVIGDTTNYFEAISGPTWSLSSGAHGFDMSAGNGRLTYKGVADIWVHCALSIAFTVSGINRLVHIRVGKNGTTDAAAELQSFVGTGSDVRSTALHLITQLSTDDYLSLFIRNATAAANVTVEAANLQVMTMPT